jgi:hypothetical protein
MDWSSIYNIHATSRIWKHLSVDVHGVAFNRKTTSSQKTKLNLPTVWISLLLLVPLKCWRSVASFIKKLWVSLVTKQWPYICKAKQSVYTLSSFLGGYNCHNITYTLMQWNLPEVRAGIRQSLDCMCQVICSRKVVAFKTKNSFNHRNVRTVVLNLQSNIEQQSPVETNISKSMLKHCCLIYLQAPQSRTCTWSTT